MVTINDLFLDDDGFITCSEPQDSKEWDKLNTALFNDWKTKTTWIKFSDKHPKEGENVLILINNIMVVGCLDYYVCNETGGCFHIIINGVSGYDCDTDWVSDMDATHWMPLPNQQINQSI